MPDPTPEVQELENLRYTPCVRCWLCDFKRQADCLNPYKECSVCSLVRDLAKEYAVDKERAVREARVDENDRAFDNLLPTTLKPDPGNSSGEIRVNTDLAYEYRNRRRDVLQSHQEKETL